MYRTIINYRREDSGGWAGRLHDRLIAHFGESDVFIDVDDIEIGKDYRTIILNNVSCCDVMISVIGPHWLECKDKNGKLRLYHEDDLLREEIKVAIEKEIELFPVLVDNASMPTSKSLPVDIQPLSLKQAYDLNNKYFHRDVTDLIEKLTIALKVAEEKKRPLSLKEKIKDLEKQLKDAKNALTVEQQEYNEPPKLNSDPLATSEKEYSSKPFNAFMVYSHASDSRLAATLQEALQSLGKPWYLLHSLRVFRDATDLAATPTLWTNIKEMIDNSEYLILLASGNAAVSKWVNEEVRYWIENHSASKILIALTDGEIFWDDLSNDFDWNKTNALPYILKGVFSEQPLYVDLRWARNDHYLSTKDPNFLISVSKLAGVLHSKSPSELIEEDKKRKRQNYHLITVGIIIIITIVALLWLMRAFS